MSFIPTLKLGKPHGLKGGVKAVLLASSPEVLEYPHTTPEGCPVTLTKVQPSTQGGLIVYVEGVTTPEAANATLRGLTLGVQEDDLPELDDDEIYLADLIGRPVVGEDGQPRGTVTGLGQTPAHDMLWLTRPDGEKRMIPVHEEYVEDFDATSLRLTPLGTTLADL